MPGPDLIAKLDRSRLKPHTKTQLGRVYAVDCMAVLAKMPDESLDLCVTSPPYERQSKYGNGERGPERWFRREGVIRAWRDVKRAADEDLDPTQAVLRYARVLIAIRKDLGHADRSLDVRDLLGVTINDIDNFLPSGRNL